jgi:hypothetical protein
MARTIGPENKMGRSRTALSATGSVDGTAGLHFFLVKLLQVARATLFAWSLGLAGLRFLGWASIGCGLGFASGFLERR